MLSKTVEAIQDGQTFLVLAHEGPDGDALGSTLALVNALNEMGKEATAFNIDGVPDKFNFLPGSESVVTTIETGRTFDVIFVLDVGELRRAQLDVRPMCKVLINVDHHPFSEDFGDIYYLDTAASATAAILYRVIKELGHPFSKDVATCIYTAILSDTGSFRYSSANGESFAIAGEMVDAGVDPWHVAGGLYESQEVERLQLLGLALNTLQVSPCGRCAALYVSQQMLDQVGVGAEFADSFVNYPRSINGVEVALFFREITSTSFKLGMRSKGTIDVGALARELGGGGHHNAAGAELAGCINDVMQDTFKRIDQLLSEMV
ncbi:MAG: phosphoesterase [Desulfuromonadales bacterium C00003068]|jgi:phosphoesterase RecJ-like protein|nr:MAG: phosphoesterase [Desulfuromonadales bacterium C00003068]